MNILIIKETKRWKTDQWKARINCQPIPLFPDFKPCFSDSDK